MKLKVKKAIGYSGPLPHYGDHTAGLILHSAESEVVVVSTHTEIPSRAVRTFRTGVSVEIADGHIGQISNLPGLALTQQVFTQIYALGVGQSAEILVQLVNFGCQPLRIKPGDPIAQLLIFPIIKVDLIEEQV